MSDDYAIHVVFGGGGLIAATSFAFDGRWSAVAVCVLVSAVGWLGVWLTYRGRNR